MNKYYIILMIIRWSVLVLLFVVPFVYSVWKGNFKRCFWFTWIVWSVVVFVYGVFVPAIAYLTAKATGEQPDVSGGAGAIGILIGWLPGLIIAPFGCFLHGLLFNRK